MHWTWGASQEAEAARGLGLEWKGDGRTIERSAEYKEGRFGASVCTVEKSAPSTLHGPEPPSASFPDSSSFCVQVSFHPEVFPPSPLGTRLCHAEEYSGVIPSSSLPVGSVEAFSTWYGAAGPLLPPCPLFWRWPQWAPP